MTPESIRLSRSQEQWFPLFLVCTLLPLVALPIANVQGSGLSRLILPLAINLLIVQSVRAVPANVGEQGWMA